MKFFLIISTLCLAGVNSFLMKNEQGTKLLDVEKKAMEQCARELNVDASKYTHTIDVDEYAENPTEEASCMLACGTRTLITEKLILGLTGKDNKETLYNGFMKLIAEAYEKLFEGENIEFTREEVENKVEQCYANEPTECGFFKCVEFYKRPFLFVFVHYVLHIF